VRGDHVIVLPGGGYRVHAPHEAEPIAAWLHGLGLEASVFRYPLSTQHPAALDAVRGEIARVRAAGAERVALIGFSAGGHAAGMAAWAPGAADDERVDLAILGYPLVSAALGAPHEGAFADVIGPDQGPERLAELSLDRIVQPGGTPAFLWHTAEDERVVVRHDLLLADALATAGVPFELHVFERGVHGIHLAEDPALGTATAWTGLCAAWLRQHGWLPA
jgi:acetyl esterase/lipase